MLSIKTIVGIVSILTPQIASTQFVPLTTALRWNQIANGTSSTINQQTHREALDASTLRNYWTQVLRQGGEPPKVDFFRDKVVIVFWVNVVLVVTQRKSKKFDMRRLVKRGLLFKSPLRLQERVLLEH